ncbi:MAG: hypothetical protein J5508_01100 [Bacteroidales bacterium]|nr:hypothetical protein [Bacteroidales bacterium]
MKHLTTILLVLFLTACSDAGIQDKLNEIDTYIDSDPQSALAALDQLHMGDVKSEKVKAHYSLLHSKALDKCYIDTTDVSVIIDAVNYYSRHGSPDEKMQSYYYLGRIHGNAGRWSESIIALTNALEAGEESVDVKYKGRIYIAMSDAHNHNYNVEEERRCVDKALEYFNASGDSVQIRAAISCKAVSSMNLSRYEEADSLFRYLLSIPDLRPSLRAKCLVKYAYLLALTDNSDYHRTFQLFRDAISEQAFFSDKDAAAYAYILWCKGDKVGSDKMFSDLEQRNTSVESINAYWKTKISEKQGHYREAYNYLKKTVEYNAEGVNKALQQSLSVAQRDYFSAVAEQRKAEVKSSKTISVLIAATSISILLLLLYIGLNLIRRHKEQNLRAAADLEHIKSHLVDLQNSSVEKDARIESLQAKFQDVFREHFRYIAQLYETYEMNRTRGYSGVSTYKHIQDVFKAIKGEEETAHIFERSIDKDMDGLISRFRADYPDLKEIDYLLFCYYVAGYDTKTISIILTEKTPNSLDAKKSRLKRMIMESDTKDKEEYLKYF